MMLRLIIVAMLGAFVSATSSVHVLTTKNFAKVNEGDWLLKFYAPWCGHCKRLEPTYEALASTLKDASSSTRLGKVDGSSERSLAAIFSITGFPTLYYVAPDGQTVYPYRGQRSEEAMLEFVKGGYKGAEPLSFWTGPFGIIGQLKWGLLYIGSFIFDLYEWLAERVGNIGAGLIIMGAGMVVTAGGVVGMTIATSNAGGVKRD